MWSVLQCVVIALVYTSSTTIVLSVCPRSVSRCRCFLLEQRLVSMSAVRFTLPGQCLIISTAMARPVFNQSGIPSSTTSNTIGLMDRHGWSHQAVVISRDHSTVAEQPWRKAAENQLQAETAGECS
ncbi:hypothetical protein F5Y18DRAFT_385064 [Xylariaceae sp. FL1019]|nr:hypothetical protein F5Y18DRAFT_385064 [Xylariaceae sp. FL1019]